MNDATPTHEPRPDWEAVNVSLVNPHALPAYETIATMEQSGKYFSVGRRGWKACISLNPSQIRHSRRMYPTEAEANAAADSKIQELTKGK